VDDSSHDGTVTVGDAVARPARTGTGLALAVVSAASFGSAGPLAGGLLATGWSPGAVVLVRVATAALVVAPFAALSLRGRWDALRRNVVAVVAYGVLAVAAAQFCYFSAVSRMDVGPALLIEYTAPAAVVGWLWVRHAQRPGRLTLAGAALTAAGLLLVLDLFSGADLDPVGVLWALGAMVGATTYFVLSADDTTGLPPLALAGGGLLTGAVGLGLLGAVGVLPLRAATSPVAYADRSVDWWVPLLVLGVVTAGLAYATGVLASRRLGSRLASFVALLEVVTGVVAAWLLLGQLPGAVQLAGGVLVLAGVVTVKLGEPRVA